MTANKKERNRAKKDRETATHQTTKYDKQTKWEKNQSQL